MFMIKIAEPDEALIISGFGARGVKAEGQDGPADVTFKVVVGKAAFVIPFFQKARRLSLAIHETEITLRCPTMQGIEVDVKAVVLYKIADDFASISNAARRFLDRSDEEVDRKVHNVFAGHLRSIIGQLTVEELIRDREKLTQKTRESSAKEMGTLGLTIDSLQVQEIEEQVNYISNLSRPHQASVERDARIAAAAADQAATENEQRADAAKAQARSLSAIQQAEAQANADKAKATADQAGPLAQATAEQDVLKQRTVAAQLEAERTEQQLQADVRKPADANAYQIKVTADAERDATIARAQAEAEQTKLSANAKAEATKVTGTADGEATRSRGLAEAEVVKAKGEAEGEAISARSSALAENSEAVVAMKIAETLPQIVREAAGIYASVDNLTVLNGAEGLADGMNKVLGMGLGAMPLIQQVIGSAQAASKASSNGTHPVAAAPAAKRARRDIDDAEDDGQE
jgi:flotillin